MIVVGILAAFGFFSSDSRSSKYALYGDPAAYGQKVEQTTTEQLQPLVPHLSAMGFENPDDLQADTCGYFGPGEAVPGSLSDNWGGSGEEHFICSYGIDRFVKLPADKTAFIAQAAELDKALLSNGWQLQSRKTTTDWVGQLKNGVEAPGDQPYFKAVNGLECKLTLWAAFSDPDPPAMSVQAGCGTDD